MSALRFFVAIDTDGKVDYCYIQIEVGCTLLYCMHSFDSQWSNVTSILFRCIDNQCANSFSSMLRHRSRLRGRLKYRHSPTPPTIAFGTHILHCRNGRKGRSQDSSSGHENPTPQEVQMEAPQTRRSPREHFRSGLALSRPPRGRSCAILRRRRIAPPLPPQWSSRRALSPVRRTLPR